MNVPENLAKKHEDARIQVVLGVTGSIAAYKSAELTGSLVKAGIDMHVIMTDNACRLVQPQTFLTLSRHQVTTSLWDVPDWRPEHIALSDSADLLVIAPATANIIGKYANGIADDALSTFALSFEGPVVIAPAMNPRMWRHPAVQTNCAALLARGVRIIDPEAGRVACGDERGPGRLAAVESIFNAVRAHLALRKWPPPSGIKRKVLISAGPTREHLDPVRYLTNRSSGKMGYALAEVAVAAGHDVTLVSGPVAIPPPAGARLLKANSAAEMTTALKAEFSNCDILIMAAAVADYTAAHKAAGKIKKSEGILDLALVRTEDILAALTSGRGSQIVVGFAAETEELEERARAKLKTKRLDWIAANDVSRGGAGFDSDTNELLLLNADGRRLHISSAHKIEVAARLLAEVLV